MRGPYPTMYVQKPWTIRQYAGFSTAEESNAFYRRNLAAGQKGLSIAFDLATHRGYDSDHPRVAGDVGMAGVAIDSILDMRQLFEGIPLDEMTVSMTMNGAVLPVMALYIVAGEEQGVPPEKLAGTIQNDILKEFMVRNTYIYPPQPSMRIVSDIFAYTSRNMPKFNSISISGYHMQEAGATADLELAYTIADGLEYARAGVAAGLDIDYFAPRLSFFWAIGMNFFMEVAKHARRPAAVGGADAEDVQPEGPEIAGAQDALPDVGLVADGAGPDATTSMRTMIEAMAATQGHTQSLHTNAFDEALALADRPFGPHRPQHPAVLQRESGTTRIIDPWGGSAYVERLTHDLAARALDAYRGGRAARRHGEGHREGHAEAAYRGGGRPNAGAHRFAASRPSSASTPSGREQDIEVDVLKVDNAEVRARQLAKLQELKGTRDVAADAGRARRADGRRRLGRRQPARHSPSRRRGRRRRSARSRSRSKRRSAAMSRRSRPFPASTGRSSARATRHRRRRIRKVRRLREEPGHEAAHPGRQDGTGRPRPRPEGHRHGVRRSRLRRRRRRDVPDAARKSPSSR